MDAAEIIARLKGMEPELRQSGLAALYLFGSRARGDAGPDSDIDLAFEAGSKGVDLWQRAELLALFVARLGTQVDLVDRNALRTRVRDASTSEMMKVF